MILLANQVIEGALLNDIPAFYHKYLVKLLQQRFVQGMRYYDPGQVRQLQNRTCHFKGRFPIQGGGGLVQHENRCAPQQASGDGYPLTLATG